MNNISFHGSETAGSVAKRDLAPERTPRTQTPIPADTINFRGRDYDNDSSFGSGILKGLVLAGVIIGGLGYAHKTNVIGKLKDGKVKDILQKTAKVTETCYKWCHEAKEFTLKYYNKVKEFFEKK